MKFSSCFKATRRCSIKVNLLNCLIKKPYLSYFKGDNIARVFHNDWLMLVKWNLSKTRGVFSLLSLPNGKLASCSYDDKIKIWDLSTENDAKVLLNTFENHNVELFSSKIGLLSNGDSVTCSTSQPYYEYDCRITQWNSNKSTTVEVYKLFCKGFECQTVIHNDDLALGDSHGLISFYDIGLKTNSFLDSSKCQTIHSKIWTIDSFNGHLICTGTSSCPTIEIMDLESKTMVNMIFTDHKGDINSVAISNDGTRMATGSNDHTIKIWKFKPD